MKKIKLTPSQHQLFNAVLTAAEENNIIHDMLYGGARTGKSFIFKFMDNYFENVPKRNAKTQLVIPENYKNNIKQYLQNQ